MLFDHLRQDSRYAIRGLARSPVFSITAILSLAIGVGGTAAIYSLANSLLLSPPAGVGNPDRVVNVGRTTDGRGFDNFSYVTFADYRDRNSTLDGLAAVEFTPRRLSLKGTEGGEAIEGAVVSGSFFDVLDVRPALGRFFLDEEDRTPRTHAVTVLSYHFWQERFGGDSSILSTGVVLNGTPFTVVGVAAEGFRGPAFTSADVWIPMMASPWLGTPETMLTQGRRGAWIMAIGRLKPDVAVSQAQADLSTIQAQLAQAYPEEYEGRGVKIMPLSLFPGDMRSMVGLFTTFLFVLTGLVLVIGGTNVAGMLLARSAARRREIAVRLAIGASRARLVRQLITESTLLFAVAGVVGTLLASWLMAALMSLIPSLPFSVSVQPSIDWRVILFALGVATTAGMLAGLAPALQSTRPALAPELRSDVGGSGKRQRLRSGLLVMQVTFSMLLLVVAGLFGRALLNARAIDPGFDPTNVHVSTLDFGLVNHTPETGRQFGDRLMQGAAAVPGVESVALVRMIPLQDGGMGLGPVLVDGRPASAENASWNADWNIVTPAFFDVLRIPIIRGRGFTEADRAGAADVAIINERLAASIWPGEEAVGKTFRNEERVITVIGVARNAKYRTLGESPRAFIYVPFAQRYHGEMSLFVRTSSAASPAPAIRRLVADLDPSLPVLGSQSLLELSAVGLFAQRIAAWVAGSLGGVALLLALIGIYGITAFGVAQRSREIGIRIALGSTRNSVLGMVVGQGLKLGALGVALGVVLAVAATRLLESLLLGVSGTDPVALGAAAVLLVGAALLASWIPALRAARIDPMVALRQE
jgi:predicted permease